MDGISTVNYLIKDNRVRWSVSSRKCLLSDYLVQFPSDELLIRVPPEGIGDGFGDLIEVILKGVSFAEAVGFLKEKIGIERIKKFTSRFVDDEGNVITDTQLFDFVLSRKEWNIHDLMQCADIVDETLLRGFLYQCGYEYKENDMFVFNRKLYESNQRQIERFNLKQSLYSDDQKCNW